MTADQPATKHSHTAQPDPLAGWPVLVTRPADTGDALTALLHAHGATVFVAPMLQVDALEETVPGRALAQQLEQFHAVIVTSRHAVQHGLPLLAQFWPQWPVGVRWLAVGATTARALGAHGLRAEAPADARSEGLLALPALQHVSGKRILLLTGEGGRGLLERELAARGATVQRLAAYRRTAVTAPTPALAAFSAAVATAGNHRPPPIQGAALVTSAEALQNLLALAPTLRTAPSWLIAASARIAEAAHAAGLAHVYNADGADDAALLAALLATAATPVDEDRT